MMTIIKYIIFYPSIKQVISFHKCYTFAKDKEVFGIK